MKAKDYRKLASDQCRKYSGELAVIQLIIEAIVLVLGLFELVRLAKIPALTYVFITIATLITVVISGPIYFSLININKKVKDGIKPETGDVFSGFARFSQAFIVDIVKSIFIALWSLLLIVPGIIKAYSYSMANYIAHDDPNISCNDAITKSRQMMNGNKGKLFCLEISYIGWILLVILTFGILGLWVMPKISQAKYNFYLNLKDKKVEAKTVKAKK